MSDPKRLAGEGGLSAALLRSARGDAPSRQTRERVGTALGLGVAAASAAATAGTAKAATVATPHGAAGAAGAGSAAAGKVTAAGMWLKAAVVSGVVLAAGGAGMLVADGTSVSTAPSSAPPRSTPPAPARTTPSSGAAALVSPSAERGSADADAVPPSAAAPTPLPADPPAATSTRMGVPGPAAVSNATHDARSATSPPQVGVLTRELRSLDEIRSLLAQGQTDRALVELDRHDRTFAGGTLRTESSLLRIEALLARGEEEKARALAGNLLTHDPSGPHARRLRSILEALSPRGRAGDARFRDPFIAEPPLSNDGGSR